MISKSELTPEEDRIRTSKGPSVIMSVSGTTIRQKKQQ